ncbi:hypothetical protein N9Y23_09985 [Pseudomonadales bacterium]|nr:hypothetical protein [Pseudomonadales bacterium]
MTDRTIENKTRMTIDGQRYRVGNPNHPHHELYLEEGIQAVYDMMYKAPADSDIPTPVESFNCYETEKGLTLFAVVMAFTLAIGGLLALGGAM